MTTPTTGPDDTDPEAPPSPISNRAHTFPHHTLAAAAVHPQLDTDIPPINAQPVELDSTPVSPAKVGRVGSWGRGGGVGRVGGGGGVGQGVEDGRADGGEGQGEGEEGRGGARPDLDDEVFGQLSGEKGGLREKRAAMLQQRSRDPAVLVDIPQTPGAEELAVAVAAAAGEGEPAGPTGETGGVGTAGI